MDAREGERCGELGEAAGLRQLMSAFGFDMPDGDFPGAEAISAEAQEQCTGSNFEDYVGLDYASSEIVVQPVTPTEETWNEADDREVLCFGANLDGSDLNETIQGSGR